MTEQEKQWIDVQAYEDLLRRWRFAPVGDPLFQGDTGAYYGKVMAQKKAALSHEERVGASKHVGWDR